MLGGLVTHMFVLSSIPTRWDEVSLVRVEDGGLLLDLHEQVTQGLGGGAAMLRSLSLTCV